MPSRFLRRDVPIAAALLTLAGLIVAGVATGSFTRLRVALLVRGADLGGPIVIHDAETVAALEDLEPAASDYLIAHADEIEPDDLLTFANAVELVYRRRGGEAAELHLGVVRAHCHSMLVPPPTEEERLLDRCLVVHALVREHGIELPLPPAVHEHLTRILADAERFAAEPPPTSDEKIDWEKIFGEAAVQPPDPR